MEMQRLKGEVAVVTGAARGIGKGIARALAKEGAEVVLFDVIDTVEETAKEISNLGCKVTWFKVSVADANQVNETIRQVLQRFGKVDILVNNAGLICYAPLVEMSDDIRDNVIDINIKGVFNCTKAVIRNMMEHKYGKIVNISSVSGPMVGYENGTAYAASKAAVSGFTKALAIEVSRYGINVNAICPGYIDTPGSREQMSRRGKDPDEENRKRGESIPLGRTGTIDEIGDLAVFLASEESKYITGAEIVIDGGNIIQETKTA